MTMNKVACLDHGFVRLVDSMGNDLSVVRSARVSYDAAWRTGDNTGSDERLINYLWRNGHTSPFESVTFTFEVRAPIFVLRQWHRHRTWSFNEVSARYTELPSDYYVPKVDMIGVQSKDNKQVRDLESRADADEVCELIDKTCQAAFETYSNLLERGVPRELARTVLPLATYSHMFATVNLMNLLKFIGLRRHEHSQHEIWIYADAMLELIREHVPASIEAFEKHTLKTAG
jgi:thymidylate synthase (FAD)